MQRKLLAPKHHRNHKGGSVSKRWGGKRKGAGRKVGTRAKVAEDTDKYIAAVMDKAAKDGKSTPSALEIFQALYADPNVPPYIRKEAAARALPYETGRQKPTESADPNASPFASRIDNAKVSLSQKLITAARTFAIAEAGGHVNPGGST